MGWPDLLAGIAPAGALVGLATQETALVKIMPKKFSNREAVEGFWRRVRKSAGCWIWTGARSRAGKRLNDTSTYQALPYGKSRWKNRNHYAHRVAYELSVGPIPPNLTIDHLCRNTLCVNPAHLEAVPIKINIQRGISPSAVNHRKSHCRKGHVLAGKNLITGKTGVRVCKICKHNNYLKTKAQHCRRGHFLSAENIIVTKNGSRQCAACRLIRHSLVKSHCRNGHPLSGFSRCLICRKLEKRKPRTHCRLGHPISGENLHITQKGSRCCKICLVGWHTRPRETHCRRGHLLTAESTYVEKTGSRTCKICRQMIERKNYRLRRDCERAQA